MSEPKPAPASHRLLYLIAAVAQGGGPLLTQPFVQRLLDPVQWGRLSLSISLISVGLIVILVGLPLIITRLYFEGVDGPRRSASLAGFGIILSLGLGTAGALITIAVFQLTGHLPENLTLVIAFAIVGMLGAIQMCLAMLRAQHRARAFVVITIGAQTLGHVAGLVAVLFVSRTATGYMLAFAVVVGATAVGSCLYARPGRPFAFAGLIANSLRTALPILPHSLALVLMLQGEAFVLTALHGPAVYGQYGAMLPMALGPLAVILALANVWETALLSQQGRASQQSVRIQREAMFVGIALVGLASLMATVAANILAGSPTGEQVQLARILPAIVVGYVVFLISTTQLVAIGRTRLMAVVTPLVALASLGVTLIPAYFGSLFWVGVIKVGALAVLGVSYLVVIGRYNPDLVQRRQLIYGLLIGLAVASTSLLLPTGLAFGLIVAACLVGAMCIVAIWWMKSGRIKGIFD